MTTILVRDTDVPQSLGVQAMTISTMQSINRYVPNAQFIIFSSHPETDHRLYDKNTFSIRIIKCQGGWKSIRRLVYAALWRTVHKLLRLDIKRLRGDEVSQAIFEADIVIDLAADAFSFDIGKLGGNISPIAQSLGILLASFLEKPPLLFPHSSGPFKNMAVRSLVRFSLNRAKTLIVREPVSEEYLRSIGVKSPILLRPDIAFILEPEPNDRIHEILLREGLCNNEAPIIGINVNQLVRRKSEGTQVREDYMALMVNLADYLAEMLNATVLFVPHSIIPYEMRQENQENNDQMGDDDLAAVKEAYNRVKHKDQVVPITNEYTATELKGIIGQCEMFIGARMHSCIAAISQCIPTIAISYSVKGPGIMRMVELEDYVCDYRTTTSRELQAKAKDMWLRRMEIKEKLCPVIDQLKRDAWANGKLVKELLDKQGVR